VRVPGVRKFRTGNYALQLSTDILRGGRRPRRAGKLINPSIYWALHCFIPR
jgi:hypothetical protein